MSSELRLVHWLGSCRGRCRACLKGARGVGNLTLCIAVILGLIICATAALHPQALSGGLLKPGSSRRVRMRLRLRSRSPAPARAWDNLALQSNDSPGFSTAPNVVFEVLGQPPPASKAKADGQPVKASGEDGPPRSATTVTVATVPHKDDLVSLLPKDEQPVNPEAAVVEEVPADVTVEANPAQAAAVEPPPVDPAINAAAAVDPVAKPVDTVADVAAEEAAIAGAVKAAEAAAVQPLPTDDAAPAARAHEEARAQERAIEEVNRPVDEDYDDDFEDEPPPPPWRKRSAGVAGVGKRKRRRPGTNLFDEGETDDL
ncbi:hypothetical protein WJX81_007813 [Elliptochloris bilobata]|uniref:Uncharacterized protein n=1 Tax=Elliptochloris bilobata TaxID=381761 RepID=A0AAW1QY60_9CHLO